MADEFTKLVEQCRKHESTQLIENAAWEHALTLFRNLIQIATDKGEPIRIISGNLHKKFYSELVQPIHDYLQSEKANLEVIVLNVNDNEQAVHPFIEEVDKSERANLITVNEENGSFSSPHFIVVGDKRFRLETDHEQTKAIASFNNPEIAEFLDTLFRKLKMCIQESQKQVEAEEKQQEITFA